MAVYIAAGAIMVYILWAMTQIGKVRFRSCKYCLHYHLQVDNEPCDECQMYDDLERPSNFAEDIVYRGNREY